MTLSPDESQRYARHLRLKGFGEAAQHKLKAARVLVIGAGGLGSPLLLYLAAAGIGTIGIIDDDTVDISNLQRQVLFDMKDRGAGKAAIAAEKLRALNPLIETRIYSLRLTADNALEIFRDYDLIADGSDNFPTRYLISDAAVLSNKPLVYGSVFRYEGQVSVFNYRDSNGETGPNYRDLFPQPPDPGTVPDCSEAGVLGVLPGIIGSMMALEVIKILTGTGNPLTGKIYHFDALLMEGITYTVNRNAENPLNGANPAMTGLIDYEAFCGGSEVTNEITVAEFFRLKAEHKDFRLIDVRTPEEYREGNIGGRLIPLDRIMADEKAFIPQDCSDDDANGTRYIFHCKSGARSLKAIKTLQSRHFTQKLRLLNLKGGMDAYLAYEKSAEKPGTL